LQEEVTQLQSQLHNLPKWLQKVITAALLTPLSKAAPAAFGLALGWLFKKQEIHITASPSKVMDEMRGMVDGVCNYTNHAICDDKAGFLSTVHQVNMLPELLKMQCSMMGAWGPATPDGKLVQLRTLDFGGGPFGKATLLVVHHPTSTEASPAPSFAAVSFPGFVGVVTGFSEKIGLSEKVDDVYNPGHRPKGSFEGTPVALVIREMLEFSTTKEKAVEIAQAAKRTWSVWLGVGDYASQEFTAMLYDQAAVVPYNDQTLHNVTDEPIYDGVAYVDKHPQPSDHHDPAMSNLIHSLYGNLTATNVASYIPQLTGSGDVHVAVYDFGKREAFVATGIVDPKDASKYIAKACQRPFLRWGLDALWAEPRPA